MDRYVIVTSDAHGGAPMEGYKAFLEPAWHDEFDAWLAGVRNPWVDLRDPEVAKRNWDSDARLAAMDADGVAAEVVFPNTLPPFFDVSAHLSGVPWDGETYARRWAGIRAHNRWLLEFAAEAPTRRKGIVQLLPNDVDQAVEEVEWAARTGGAAGVMLPAVPPNHLVEPYFSRRYDPLWAACVDAGLPVHQHQGSGSPDPTGDDDALARTIFFTELDLWTRRTLTHLIVGGVFERHPDLQVVWTEMWGLRWAVDDLDRITRRLRNVQARYADDPRALNYSQTFGSPTTDGLTLDPLGYFGRNCWIGASMLPRHEVRYRHALGVDRILWGTDFPHDEGSAPWTTEALRATVWDVPEDELRPMLGESAARLYGFDLNALRDIAARIGPRVEEVAQPLDPVPARRSEAFAGEDPLEAALR
jgi:predicted TIM-barrel fold metal-dependent hydrolase